MSNFDFVDNSQEFVNELNEKLRETLTALGVHITSEAQDELENNPRRVDTGNLRNSISSEYVDSEKTVYIGTNVEYAPYVHEGTLNMLPNKFLKNAVEKNKEQIKEYITESMKK